MRVGQNPAKFVKEVAKPARITVAVLNYIPFLSGFYAEMLDVLKASLGNIWTNTDPPYDLMVFDNGSCEEVRQYLSDSYEQGRIQYLLLSSRNLGKGGAWNQIFGGAPGEIIAYADNDCYFYPGWLSQSMQILEATRTWHGHGRPLSHQPGVHEQHDCLAEHNPQDKSSGASSSPTRSSGNSTSAWGRARKRFACITRPARTCA